MTDTHASAPRVALVGGQWAQNVGNAFFNLGGEYVLKRVFGESAVAFVQDQPNYRTLHNKMKGNPANYVDFVRYLDIDYLVLQGPLLNAWMRVTWEDTFRELKARGVKVILLSCAFFKFRDSEIAAVKAFLEEYPPALIATRDDRSYEILKNWSPQVPKYNGIDSGYFLNRCVTPFRPRPDFRYIAVNFDRYPEPDISRTPFDARKFNARSVEIDGKNMHLGVPKFLDKSSHRSKIRAYFADLTDRRKLPESFDGRMIIRPEHRFFPHVTHKIYRQTNSTASDEPWSYINIYANADFTLSDRVHACVATLAFGRKAMLFTPSPRAALFGRIGLEKIKERLVGADQDLLHEEQEKEIEWLRARV